MTVTHPENVVEHRDLTTACGPAGGPSAGAPTEHGSPSVRANCHQKLVYPRPDGEDHYSISEVTQLTGLSAHTIRWYERIGLMPSVDRSHTGQRRFRNRDLDWLDLVGKLRLTGMPVAGMLRYAELVQAGEQTYAEREQLLRATRENTLRQIDALRDTVAVLDYKIGIYSDARTAASERAHQ